MLCRFVFALLSFVFCAGMPNHVLSLFFINLFVLRHRIVCVLPRKEAELFQTAKNIDTRNLIGLIGHRNICDKLITVIKILSYFSTILTTLLTWSTFE